MKKDIGRVIKLFISQREEPKRQNRAELYLDKKGVVDDKFYGKDLERSILMSSLHSYKMALDSNIEMEYGTLGENILINYNLYSFAGGTKLEIGDNVIIEITKNCTICNHLSVIDKSLPKLLRKDRGIFVKVIKEGFIKEGDIVSLS